MAGIEKFGCRYDYSIIWKKLKVTSKFTGMQFLKNWEKGLWFKFVKKSKKRVGKKPMTWSHKKFKATCI